MGTTRIAVSTAKWSVIALVGLVSILVLAGLGYPRDRVEDPDVTGALSSEPSGGNNE
jgi:hypothetical protein